MVTWVFGWLNLLHVKCIAILLYISAIHSAGLLFAALLIFGIDTVRMEPWSTNLTIEFFMGSIISLP